LTKKLSDKDKKDWQNFINSEEKINNKDKIESKMFLNYNEKTIDLHGYTLEEANKKINSFIEECFLLGVNKINIITGKGLRSKNLDDPYKSNNLSILKYSVPDFIKNNSSLMDKILKIDFEAVNSSLKGNFEVLLKKKK
tara:strand:+ start:5643 stop:6059 length:417 start_codon:yes stop_codon:yes gene_type:complete